MVPGVVERQLGPRQSSQEVVDTQLSCRSIFLLLSHFRHRNTVAKDTSPQLGTLDSQRSMSWLSWNKLLRRQEGVVSWYTVGDSRLGQSQCQLDPTKRAPRTSTASLDALRLLRLRRRCVDCRWSCRLRFRAGRQRSRDRGCGKNEHQEDSKGVRQALQ